MFYVMWQQCVRFILSVCAKLGFYKKLLFRNENSGARLEIKRKRIVLRNNFQNSRRYIRKISATYQMAGKSENMKYSYFTFFEVFFFFPFFIFCIINFCVDVILVSCLNFHQNLILQRLDFIATNFLYQSIW